MASVTSPEGDDCGIYGTSDLMANHPSRYHRVTELIDSHKFSWSKRCFEANLFKMNRGFRCKEDGQLRVRQPSERWLRLRKQKELR